MRHYHCTCSHCEELLEEIAYLRSELGLAITLDEIAKIQTALKLSPQQSRLLLHLYHNKGRIVGHVSIHENIKSEAEESGNGWYVRAVVSQTRRKIGKANIQQVYGIGYFLSPSLRQRIAEILA